MCLRPVDVIPHNQNILDKPHLLNDTELIFHILIDCIALFLRVGIIVRIFLFKSLVAQSFQELIGRVISLWHLVFWDLIIAKFNRHMAAVRNLLCIVHRFLRIREKCPHLVLTLDVELSPLIAHTILIRNLLTGLDAKKHIMCLHIIRIRIMHIIRTDKPDPRLLTHAHQLLIDQLLIRNSMILQF